MFFINTHIITTLLCLILQVYHELIISRDLADNGYKFDKNKLFEAQIVFNDYIFLTSKMHCFVPILNVFQVIESMMAYSINRGEIIDRWINQQYVISMHPIEKTEYNNHPTGLNARYVTRKMDKRLKKANRVKVKIDNRLGYIFFEMYKNNTIVILQVNGSAETLEESELRNVIIDYINNPNDNIVYLKKIPEEYRNNNIMVEAERKKTNEILDKELTTSQKAILEEIKRELLNNQTMHENNINHDKDEKVYKKKK